MSTVSIRGLDVRLSGIDILAGLDLDVAAGEFLVLLGPSGCGKSTLLHAIAGLVDVRGGTIAIDGHDVTWADPKDRGIGMVFQSYALYPTMTVEKNLSFGPRIAGIDRREIARRVERAAKMLQLTELLARKPAQLSGGQRQRVAIGRALVREARVLLFDEPLSNLDAQLRAELRRELKQLHKDVGATMIYVTHDQVEAMTLASRIAVMKQGRLLQVGTPSEIYDRPSNLFVAGFLGAPSMNFIEGRLEQDASGRCRVVSEAMTLDVSAYPFVQPPRTALDVVLGVRPEQLALCDVGEGEGRGQVALVEPLGASQVVWLQAQGVSVAIDTEAGAEAVLDESVGFRLAPRQTSAQLSLFDRASQQRL